MAGWLLIGGLALARQGRTIFRDAPLEMPPPEMWSQIAAIDRLAPAREAMFYVMPARETWDSRMWKRAFYPRPVFYVEGEKEIEGVEYQRLRRKYGIRYALSVGDPPLDPGFLWKRDLPPLPGRTARGWFGELR